MGLAEIVKLISDNGFAAVAAAAFIIMGILNQKRISRMMNDFTEDARKREKIYNDQMAVLIKNTSKTHPIEEDAYQEEINKNIDNILKQLREATGSCRAMLVKYHNGMYDLNGNSAIKMSTTNEDVAIGIQPFQPSFQNQFRGLLTYWCSEIRDKGKCYISNIDTLKDINENSMYEFLKNRNVIGWYGYAVRDTSNNPIGFIVVEYIAEVCVLPIAIEEQLKDKASKISVLLNLDKGGW